VTGTERPGRRRRLDGDQLRPDGEPVDEARDAQEVDEDDQEKPEDLFLMGDLPWPVGALDDVDQGDDEEGD